MHISDHIQEWHRRKRLINAFTPPEFLLEWFLKYLFPYIAKDVSTSKMKNEEQVIFRSQQIDLVNAQFGLLYEIIPNTPRSNFNPNLKPGPHADGIVGSARAKPVSLVTNQMNNLYVNQPVLGQAMTSSHPTQIAKVLLVQSSNQKGNQQPGQNKKKGKNNRKGGNKNDNDNNDKNNNNVGGTRNLSVRLNFLVRCVQMITSLAPLD